MENLIEIVSVPVIATIVYMIMAIYRNLTKDKAGIWTSLIPLWAALLGAILGIVAFFAAPSIIPADNVLLAIVIGMASGLSATGVNQIWKQLAKAAEKKDATTETGGADDPAEK